MLPENYDTDKLKMSLNRVARNTTAHQKAAINANFHNLPTNVRTTGKANRLAQQVQDKKQVSADAQADACYRKCIAHGGDAKMCEAQCLSQARQLT